MRYQLPITDVVLVADYDGQGHPAVTANVDGWSTAWYLWPVSCAAGRHGWRVCPEQGCVDADMVDRFGMAEALRIGRKVATLVSRGQRSGTLPRLCECSCECSATAAYTVDGVLYCATCRPRPRKATT